MKISTLILIGAVALPMSAVTAAAQGGTGGGGRGAGTTGGNTTTAGAGAAAAAGSTSVAAPDSGIFTAEQAKRGEQGFMNVCVSCHFPEEHSNRDFKINWNTRPVWDMYDIIAGTMPQDNPGGLSSKEYIDIVAYVLKLNGMPAGTKDLTANQDTLKMLKIKFPPPPSR